MEDKIRIVTYYGLLSFIQYEMNVNNQYYNYFPHEEWCGFLSTLEAKDNRKSDAAQIKILDNYKFVLDDDSNTNPKVPYKNKDRNDIMLAWSQNKNALNHEGIQWYCMLCKKSEIT